MPTVRSVLDMKRLPYGLVAAAAGSYVLAIALSWHGPNQWPYAWLDGVRRPEFPPAIKRVLQDKRFKVSTNGPRAAACRTC